MGKTKITRSSTVKEESVSEIEATERPSAKVNALRKVFYIADHLLTDAAAKLKLESFYHPGKERMALFITKENNNARDNFIMEVLEFTEQRRSFLIDSNVCSNGRIYMTTPIDATFLALHHIRNHCKKNAMSLDSIEDTNCASTRRLLTTFVQPKGLDCVSDIKTAGGDERYYKYNAEKTLAWLVIKTQNVSASLRQAKVHCGESAISQNYTRSEVAAEETVQDMDYLRMACDIVGAYIDRDLYEELVSYFEIPIELINNKRKSLQALNSNVNKKIKLDSELTGAMAKLKDSNILNSSEYAVMEKTETVATKITPLKERTLSAKEKSLAKGAKGTKSISSFFKK